MRTLVDEVLQTGQSAVMAHAHRQRSHTVSVNVAVVPVATIAAPSAHASLSLTNAPTACELINAPNRIASLSLIASSTVPSLDRSSGNSPMPYLDRIRWLRD